MNITLDEHLKLDKCPHCSVDNPNLSTQFSEFTTTADTNTNARIWRIYYCKRCGGVTVAWAYGHDRVVRGKYPETEDLDDCLPAKVKVYLQQAIDSVFAPAGAAMLCASAVDEMLKQKGYIEGSLYNRIRAANSGGLLTQEMETWAHKVRLDANDIRHADENASLPTIDDAKQLIEFTKTLAELLFVLPSKIQRGLLGNLVNNRYVGGRG